MTEEEKKLSGLYPPFAKKVQSFLYDVRSRKDPFPVGVFCGMRTFEEQSELYRKGRDAQGNIVDKSAIITKARPGWSWHQYGCAVDIVFDKSGNKQGFQWAWDKTYPWDKMALIGKSVYGLDAGFFWTQFPDPPHFQIMTDMKIHEAYNILLKDGLAKVWETLDKN